MCAVSLDRPTLLCAEVPELVRALFATVAEAIRDHQFLVLFVIIAIEEAGVPLPAPGDLVIAYFGWRSGGAPLAVAQVILTCAAASATGTLAPYALARRFGEPVAKRVAGWLDVDVRSVARLEARVARYGMRGVIVARLIPGLRVAVSLVAGTARLPLREFTPGIFIAAAIYWSGWAVLGAIVGPRVRDVVRPAYIQYIVIAIPIVFLAFFFGRLIWARTRRRA